MLKQEKHSLLKHKKAPPSATMEEIWPPTQTPESWHSIRCNKSVGP